MLEVENIEIDKIIPQHLLICQRCKYLHSLLTGLHCTYCNEINAVPQKCKYYKKKTYERYNRLKKYAELVSCK